MHPPGISLLLKNFPPVYGVAPELSGFAEIIGGDTGDKIRSLLIIQLKNLWMRPHVNTVMFNVDGNIADDLNPLIVTVIS